MKYQVENAVRNANQIAGIEPYDPKMKNDYVGDYIEADSAEEAIELAIAYIIEHSELSAERTDDGIIFYSDGVAKSEFFGFIASEQDDSFKIYGSFAYEYDEEFDCYAIYRFDCGWNETGVSFETEAEAIEYCENHPGFSADEDF